MTDTTAPTETDTDWNGAAAIGVTLFVICTLAGMWLGATYQATVIRDTFSKSYDFTTATDGTEGAFNWLLFGLFAMPGAICLAVGLTAGSIVNQLRR